MKTYVFAFWVLLPLLWLAARRWGGTTEQRVATLYIVAAIATAALRTAWSERYHHVEPGVLLVDVALLLATAREAANSNRWWPIWSTALLAISTLSHVGKALNPSLMPNGYALMAGASSYPVLITLAIGIIGHARRTAPRRSST